mgnify:CR=1 FL=1
MMLFADALIIRAELKTAFEQGDDVVADRADAALGDLSAFLTDAADRLFSKHLGTDLAPPGSPDPVRTASLP